MPVRPGRNGAGKAIGAKWHRALSGRLLLFMRGEDRPRAGGRAVIWPVEFPRPRVHIGRMNDQWTEQLRCPRCSKIGMASLSQGELDQTPAVLTVPDGFKVVQTEYGPDFHCGTCNVPVDP